MIELLVGVAAALFIHLVVLPRNAGGVSVALVAIDMLAIIVGLFVESGFIVGYFSATLLIDIRDANRTTV